ncbi:MAG: iron-sulfur cluster assembly protein, partial [Planctomycetota bacterium JB042]
SAAAPAEAAAGDPPKGEATVRHVDESPLRGEVIEALKRVYDPEIPVDIWELGLIYAVRIGDGGKLEVDMTLTSPHCPSAEELPGDAEKRLRAIEGVNDVKVQVVWDPPWDKEKMSEVAMLELGMD